MFILLWTFTLTYLLFRIDVHPSRVRENLVPSFSSSKNRDLISSFFFLLSERIHFLIVFTLFVTLCSFASIASHVNSLFSILFNDKPSTDASFYDISDISGFTQWKISIYKYEDV